jgi:hypothetical protein
MVLEAGCYWSLGERALNLSRTTHVLILVLNKRAIYYLLVVILIVVGGRAGKETVSAGPLLSLSNLEPTTAAAAQRRWPTDPAQGTKVAGRSFSSGADCYNPPRHGT